MRGRIVVATLVVLATTAVVGSLLVLMIQRSIQVSAERELGRQATVTARLIEEDFADIDVSPGRITREEYRTYRNALGRSLDRARDLGGHDVVEASLQIGARELPIGPAPTIASVDPLTRGVTTITTSEGNLLVAVEQVEVDGGVLTVWIGRAEPLFPSGVVIWSLLVAIGAGAVMSILLAGWFVRSLSRRLGSIEAAAEAIRDGDLSARADDNGHDEIGQLAASFDAMAVQLEESRVRERAFLMSVGHDLRTPLTTIRGYAEALDDGVVPPDRTDDVASALHRQTDVLSRLVEDVMLLARLESAEFTLRPEPVDAAGLVRGVVDGYRDRAERAGITIELSASPSVEVVVDPDRYAQVVANLMDNALRYTPSGGRIDIEFAVGDRSTELSVTNSGDPIASHDLPRVFDRLYVADRYRSERPAGSGLGLAIVEDLVSAMGGAVTCTSDATEGTRFVVRVDSRVVVPT